jgi:hypothetical protein
MHDLGWRIGDFINIKKDMLPNLERETPIAFDLVTEKYTVLVVTCWICFKNSLYSLSDS